MKRLRTLALYEFGDRLHPYCSGHLRLLRPLGYPTLRDRIELTASRSFDAQRADVVIVERLWRPGISPAAARRLIERIRASGAKLVYSQDDNIFDLHQGLPGQDWLTQDHVEVMELLARAADGVLVTTEPLRRRMARYNDRIFVVPNALDERLICARPADARLRGDGPVVIGYMGTANHDDDLESVAPALRRVHARWGDRVVFELVGALARATTLSKLGLPLRVIEPDPLFADYPLFFSWFTQTVSWDIGIAPLRDNVFNVCKSDIKFLDYSAIGAVGVYSRLAPYDSVVDGELGLVAGAGSDAWAEALDRLIADAPLRARIASAAAKNLFARRTLARTATRWADVLEAIVAGRSAVAAEQPLGEIDPARPVPLQ